MKNKRFLLFALVVAIVSIMPAFCFGFNTHERISLLKDGMRLSPPELRSFFEKWEEAVVDGMKMVDGIPLTPLKPEDLPMVYEALVAKIQHPGPDTYKTAHAFGILACFVAETICPGPVFSGYDMTPELVTLDGFREIPHPGDRMRELVEKFRVPFYSDRRPEAVAYLYDASVNAIVDFWVNAWREAGNEVAQLPQKGEQISHAKKALYAATEKKKEEEKKKSSGGGAPTFIGGMPGGMTVMMRSFK